MFRLDVQNTCFQQKMENCPDITILICDGWGLFQENMSFIHEIISQVKLGGCQKARVRRADLPVQ